MCISNSMCNAMYFVLNIGLVETKIAGLMVARYMDMHKAFVSFSVIVIWYGDGHFLFRRNVSSCRKRIGNASSCKLWLFMDEVGISI